MGTPQLLPPYFSNIHHGQAQLHGPVAGEPPGFTHGAGEGAGKASLSLFQKCSSLSF